ncbi:MAG: hypothetical protein SPJ69_04645 [Campylobacter sp.]|nr:hypothetical protein [Campylobacter sp.]MDD7600975.1 hypothetical protein [Campylobacteraceae bacterium]MDD7741892.1 hypothetical protein [Campylobacteraceae bacterium]MDY4120721.1 hypothetical protein [Campylobacter sp.]MDY5887591.1 hypothetical protein [Campylobacter sp.]
MRLLRFARNDKNSKIPKITHISKSPKISKNQAKLGYNRKVFSKS